ncbi:MAG: hypothetical protein IH614_06585 [Desulfuromonadales bacterium]|nr:hypothetical protein [Desulfuromonadales bacterium]
MGQIGFPASNQRGFSLLDIIIGLFLFSVGMLAVMKMQLLATELAGTARLRSQAAFLAEQRMEELLRLDYPLVGSGTEDIPPHMVTWSAGGGVDYKVIDLTVTWPYKGVQTLSLSSIRGDLRPGGGP